jgi:hypothetical protein
LIFWRGKKDGYFEQCPKKPLTRFLLICRSNSALRYCHKKNAAFIKSAKKIVVPHEERNWFLGKKGRGKKGLDGVYFLVLQYYMNLKFEFKCTRFSFLILFRISNLPR